MSQYMRGRNGPTLIGDVWQGFEKDFGQLDQFLGAGRVDHHAKRNNAI